MAAIFLRTLILYITLTAVMRLMGKRQIGELQLPEFVAAVMISQIASIPVADRDIPLLHGLVPVLTLGALEVTTAFACKKIPRLRRHIYGEPLVLMEDGRIDEKTLEKARISAEEVLAAVRSAGLSSPDDAECVILEQSGKLTVLARKSSSPLTFEGAGISAEETGAELPVMTEGAVIRRFAEARGKDEKAILEELKKRGINPAQTLYMTVDRKGGIKTAQSEKGKK